MIGKEQDSGQVAEGREHASVLASVERSDVYRNYQQAFENTLGLPLALVRPEAASFPLAGSRHQNRFCALMASRHASCAACLGLQQRLHEGACEETSTMTCDAGLTESAVPVRVGNRLVGFLRTGQVFLQRPSRSRFTEILRRAGIALDSSDAAHLEFAYFRTRVLGTSQYGAALSLLVIFAHHLANRLLLERAKAEPPAIANARAVIVRHLAEPLRLQDVARAVSVSPFYLCKLFSRAMGLTFTQYVARTRIEVVKHHLLNPNTRVCEAAYAAGFRSLSQFNRVFRRVAGESPTIFRDRLRWETTSLRRSGGPAGDRAKSGRAHQIVTNESQQTPCVQGGRALG